MKIHQLLIYEIKRKACSDPPIRVDAHPFLDPYIASEKDRFSDSETVEALYSETQLIEGFTSRISRLENITRTIRN